MHGYILSDSFQSLQASPNGAFIPRSLDQNYTGSSMKVNLTIHLHFRIPACIVNIKVKLTIHFHFRSQAFIVNIKVNLTIHLYFSCLAFTVRKLIHSDQFLSTLN